MPRLSNLQILKNTALANLASARRRLDGRTYASYERKINDTNRKDVVNKLNDTIRLIKDIEAPAKTLTLKEIKTKPKVVKTKLVKLIKDPNLRDVLNKRPKFINATLIDKIKF